MRTFLSVVWTAAATCILAAPHPPPSTLLHASRARRSPQDSEEAKHSSSVLPPPGSSLSSRHKDATGTSSTHPAQLASTPSTSPNKQESRRAVMIRPLLRCLPSSGLYAPLSLKTLRRTLKDP
ncbi:uncharacterized protein LOC123509722 [Portunus trituberculatus]|uniref:uncharacterized protein LOC123509722 n=1 Tax=Portunus trituberculatus TaxID=210409 RepID=UPI001E1D1F0B|nr:uncharacterized protein LOC123509722 [Portunus trituberculatus]